MVTNVWAILLLLRWGYCEWIILFDDSIEPHITHLFYSFKMVRVKVEVSVQLDQDLYFRRELIQSVEQIYVGLDVDGLELFD